MNYVFGIALTLLILHCVFGGWRTKIIIRPAMERRMAQIAPHLTPQQFLSYASAVYEALIDESQNDGESIGIVAHDGSIMDLALRPDHTDFNTGHKLPWE